MDNKIPNLTLPGEETETVSAPEQAPSAAAVQAVTAIRSDSGMAFRRIMDRYSPPSGE